MPGSKTSRPSLRGCLAFFPSPEVRDRLKKAGCEVFFGVDRWWLAKAPAHGVVYDQVGLLQELGAPILDALYLYGAYIRQPISTIPTEPTPVQLTKARILSIVEPVARPLSTVRKSEAHKVRDADGLTLVDAEAYAAATGAGKMSRGVGHRVKAKK